MPTGYTAGIIDGTTKTFKDFAKQCMRNFGACIHMRDDSWNIKYTPRVPDKDYLESLQETKQKLEKLNKTTDKELIKQKKKELEEYKKQHLKDIEETKKRKRNLEKFLLEANSYNPPTKEHNGIKEFMIQQITDTIKWDADTEYDYKELKRIETELKNIDVNSLRSDRIEDLNKDIKYYTEKYEEEVKRCEESNKWVTDFLDSLEK